MFGQEVIRAIGSSPHVRRTLRAVTGSSHLPYDLRFFIYRGTRHFRVPAQLWFKFRSIALSGDAASVYWLGTYEPETLDILRDRARMARTALDVGARYGILSLIMADANPQCRILAFEPDPEAYEILARHAAANRHVNVEPIRVALGDETGEAEFFLLGGNSSLNGSFRRGATPKVVEVFRGDDFLQTHGVTGVDLIKIDTESTEPAVLRGLRSTIERDHPEIIVEVLAGRTEDSLNDFVETFGYQAFHLTDNGPQAVERISGDRSYRYLNYLLSHPESAYCQNRNNNWPISS